jgi:hypothetical protein
MFVARKHATFEDAEVIIGAQPYGGRIEAAVERVLNA